MFSSGPWGMSQSLETLRARVLCPLPHQGLWVSMDRAGLLTLRGRPWESTVLCCLNQGELGDHNCNFLGHTDQPAHTHVFWCTLSPINAPGLFYPSSLGLTSRPNAPGRKGSSLDLHWARTLQVFAHKRRKVQTSNCLTQTPCTILGH